MRRIASLSTLVLFLGMAAFSAAPVQAQSETALEHADADLTKVAQKPVAVDKLVEATGDPDAVQDLARSLNEGNVDATTFNQTVSGAAQTGSLEGINEVGQFVNQQVEDGVAGEQLAQSIHTYLNENFGIPAGGLEAGSGPPPIAENFIPANARNSLGGQRPQPGVTNRPGPSNRPGSVGGSPGRAGPPEGVGPSSIPGRTGSPAGGPPSSPGAP